MAEAIAIVASVIAVIQLSDRLVGVVKTFIESSKDAPKDFRVILNEISTLKTIFENLKFLIQVNGADSVLLPRLEGPGGPVEGCQVAIKELTQLITEGFDGPVRNSQKKRKLDVGEQITDLKIQMSRFHAKLAWPLKESKARKLLDDLSRYKATINLALANETSWDLKRVRNDVHELRQAADQSEFRKVLAWLVSTDPSSNHHQAYELHEAHTGQWLLRSDLWLKWSKGDNRFLWIHGIPGSGKTVLASFLISEMEKMCQQLSDPKDQTSMVCTYYYCYYGRNHEETSHLLRWVLSQICQKLGFIPSCVRSLYQNGCQPSDHQLLTSLKECIGYFDRVYIIVDAADESKRRERLARYLTELIADKSYERIQLAVFSRNEADLRSSFTHYADEISMSNSLVDHDISSFIQSALNEEPKFQRWSEPLLKEIESSLVAGAQGMYVFFFSLRQ